MISRRKLMAGAALAIFALVAPALHAAQDKPITIVVGSPAGGTTDALARLIARSMGDTLHRTVVVDNRPGAGGNIAAQYVARSTPDGSTLLMSFTGHTINASLYKNLPFDPVKDFTPITMVARVPSVLVARKNAPFDTTAGLIDYARRNPGKLTFAIGAQGSSLHLASEQFKLQTGADIVNVPYKGTNPALTDLLGGGTVDLMFASTVNVLPHLKAGTLKFLGVSSKDALPQFPGVPPIGATVKGFESSAWFGLFGPAKLPAATTDQLYRAVRIALEDPAYKQRMETEAATTVNMTPQAFAQFVRADIQHWARVIQASGTRVE
ncbi:Bug family tripartite tricarboxylate transporter substrate binding protein [Cupriavidus pauculus]|uniref:Bug family tripartite tricarboxylate transporter substrate binding protein n=1 Tax=Cupriavidus pauculus TaxID=82633 RepID=UPI0012483FE2|nr:tripartite tricarboxylate transporter substrate binding protein [Cupriavidus pauculus]KAB0603014.1 tripartite tricarboxylate transporter substrate binding protein [Cupriavidus pauculus]UAL03075.1 tripartite tricarboxylate transporter substrate binding protein [Cupriavidus pauculus]